MADIFLSYSNKDERYVQPLVGQLEEAGWSIFWDRKILPGISWRDRIGEELERCRCVVVLWSAHSVKSNWVIEEADEARARGILVPARVGSTIPPLGFRQIQCVDLIDADGRVLSHQLSSLLDAIRLRIDPTVRAESPPPTHPIQRTYRRSAETSAPWARWNRKALGVWSIAILGAGFSLLFWKYAPQRDVETEAPAQMPTAAEIPTPVSNRAGTVQPSVTASAPLDPTSLPRPPIASPSASDTLPAKAEDRASRAVKANTPDLFRSTCARLSVQDVMSFLTRQDLFDNRWSPNARYKGQLSSTKQQGAMVITDAHSNLMWTQQISSEVEYDEAVKVAETRNALRHAGFNDWRIPTLEELSSLMMDKVRDGRRCHDQGYDGDVCIDPSFKTESQFFWSCDRRKDDAGTRWGIMYKANVPQHYSMWRTAAVLLVRSQ